MQSQQQRPSRLSDFQVLRQVGKGSYGSVYQVERKSDKKIYALKKVKLRNMSQKEKENSFNEIRCLASMKHRNILGYYDAFMDGDENLCIITEFVNGGDLETRIKKLAQAKSFFSENDIWNIFIQMCDGVKALHSWNIIHRDLKCANVFLDADGTIRLGDFGVSKVLSKEKWAKTQIGTPYYVSPEMWKNRPYDMKSDIWSLGCILYEMTALHPPFRANDVNSLARKAMGGMYPQIPYRYSSDLAATIKKLLDTNPSSRPNIDDVLGLPVIKKQRERMALERTKEESRKTEMLATIVVPRDNRMAKKIELPGPRYEDENSMTPMKAELPPVGPGRSNYSGNEKRPPLSKISENEAVPSAAQQAAKNILSPPQVPPPSQYSRAGVAPRSSSAQYGNFYSDQSSQGRRGVVPVKETYGQRSVSEPTGYVSNRPSALPYGYPVSHGNGNPRKQQIRTRRV
uniref:non-specific serine/threonine protein kinase n=1 Tax=Palpitomonas bilix TaxID=652834 RepID=A0A7S3G4B8_9EUKA|mmetsp:Transcript_18098/g.45217  ORF Transcript_18098/g.45217 Transcript_18098/m.45217 type:complete len:457 (+) Transcript_18098:183-1553(+)|eukprot:CAMPEP_0113875336 /NCGR_PEP_ID=MMETSP0780_2-20120614/4891_1 /TAXON_ID=652834 /ORGANISM="Palpitomonas bilix" /LENGTH=456 /DNA_ID=CAMNT_0000861325 /DNA_START=177 /DNA_END=1547 /DNA_ORIENTATION=- /assembly_acc=CAM_ASM_000599